MTDTDTKRQDQDTDIIDLDTQESEQDSPAFKMCNKCNIEKEFDQFRKDTRAADGYSKTCNQCKSSLSVDEKLVGLRDSTQKAISNINDRVAGLETGIQDILKAMKAPAVVQKSFEAAGAHLGKNETPEFKVDESENVCIKPRRNLDVNDAEFKRKNDMEMFMRQMVKVHIHHASDKNADPVFSVGVNGKTEYFARGETKTVMRMFVEGFRSWARTAGSVPPSPTGRS